MKVDSKTLVVLVLAFSFFVSFTERGNADMRRGKQVEATTFYFNGSQWLPIWFQCDLAKEVILMLQPSSSPTHKSLTFQKSQPSVINDLELVQQGEAEPDIGGKTIWTFKAASALQPIYSVLEVNYSATDDANAGYWTTRHVIGIGEDENTATSKKQQCRWLPRTRVALITDTASIYVTETASGRPVFKSYEYKQATARPALTLIRGTAKRDKDRRIESFTFKKGRYTYIVTVNSPDQPSAQLLVLKNTAVIRKDTVRAYTYTTKP